MNRYDYRTPVQKFAHDLAPVIAREFGTSTQTGASMKPGAQNIVAVIGGVQFTITVTEGRRR